MLQNRQVDERFVVTGIILRSIIPIFAMIFTCQWDVTGCSFARAQDAKKVQEKKDGPATVRNVILSDLLRVGTKVEQNDRKEITGVSISASDRSLSVLTLLKHLPKLEKIEIQNARRIPHSSLVKIAKFKQLKELSLLSAFRLTKEGLKEVAKLENLEKLSITGFRLRDLSSIATLTKLKSLDLSSTYVDENALKKLQSLKNLKELKIENCGMLKGLAPEVLADFTTLESLSVKNNQWFGDRHLTEIAKLKKLSHLDLWATTISDKSLKALQSFPALRSLKISGSQLTDLGMGHLASLKNLEILGIYRTKMTDKSMISIGKLVKLKSLELRRCNEITDKGFKHLENLTELKELDLSLTPVKDPTLKRIAKLKNLEVLKLAFCKDITDEGLKHVGQMKKLKVLSLESTKIHSLGLQKLSNLPNLRELNLNNCSRVSDIGLSAMKNMKKLEKLELRSTAVQLIPHLHKLPKLKFLILYNTKLADAGLRNLRNMKQLRYLDLRRTRITKAGLVAIRKTLKSIDIQANPVAIVSRTSRSNSNLFVIVKIDRTMNNAEKTAMFEKLKKLADSTRLSTNYTADTATGTMFFISPVSDPTGFKSKLEANIEKIKVKKFDALEREITVELED